MTDRARLLALADQVKQLDEPCRETDLSISVAVNYMGAFAGFDAMWSTVCDDIYLTSHKEYMTKTGAHKRNTGYLCPVQFVPRWTESIDAALRLVQPPLNITNLVVDGPSFFRNDWMVEMGVSHSRGAFRRTGNGKTLNLAITAAALRAIAEGLD